MSMPVASRPLSSLGLKPVWSETTVPSSAVYLSPDQQTVVAEALAWGQAHEQELQQSGFQPEGLKVIAPLAKPLTPVDGWVAARAFHLLGVVEDLADASHPTIDATLSRFIEIASPDMVGQAINRFSENDAFTAYLLGVLQQLSGAPSGRFVTPEQFERLSSDPEIQAVAAENKPAV